MITDIQLVIEFVEVHLEEFQQWLEVEHDIDGGEAVEIMETLAELGKIDD